MTTNRLTYYTMGDISPFGMSISFPVFVEKSILSLLRLFIDGGRGGVLVEVSPSDLVKALNPPVVKMAR